MYAFCNSFNNFFVVNIEAAWQSNVQHNDNAYGIEWKRERKSGKKAMLNTLVGDVRQDILNAHTKAKSMLMV